MKCRHLVLIACILTGHPALAFGATDRQFSTHYAGLQGATLLAADNTGNLFVVSAAGVIKGSSLHVAKTDNAGNLLATFDFGGSGTDIPNAAATDPDGNLVIAGVAVSPDFPLVSPLQTTGSGFVTKLDSQLRRIVYSTRMSSPAGANGVLYGVRAIAFDSAANLYLTGDAGPGLPVTAGAFQSQPPTLSSFAIAGHGFVAEISAAGDRLIFSTYYTGGAARCGAFCGGPAPVGPVFIQTTPTAIAVDSSGAVIIAGATDVNDLPVTADAYATQCGCLLQQLSGFVAKFEAGGTKLIWGTYLPLADPSGYAGAGFDGVTISAIALDASRNILIAGATLKGFPITPGALQPVYPASSSSALTPPKAGFLATLDASGSKLAYSTYFGGNAVGTNLRPFNVRSGVQGMAIDNQGAIWLTGASSPDALPSNPSAILGQNYVAALSPDGGSLSALYTAPDGAAGTAIVATSQGTVAALGYPGSLLIARTTSGPSVLGVAGTPAFRVSPVVAPRELISIYGFGLGPATPLGAQIANGVIADSLGGVRVLFDGQPAALLFVSPTQINAIVPTGVAGSAQTAIRIETPSGVIDGPTLFVAPSLPAVFEDLSGRATASNQDGTLNSATNPAIAGSIVAVWITGGGDVNHGRPDNRINSSLNNNPFPVSVLSSANDSGQPRSLEVLYAGDAPQQPSGVEQVNFRLPNPLSVNATVRCQIQVGVAISDPFYVYVK